MDRDQADPQQHPGVRPEPGQVINELLSAWKGQVDLLEDGVDDDKRAGRAVIALARTR
jgi:hypothetical protein